jgi:hypothetical protein
MQNVHLAITGFCALMSVALAAVQTFRSEPEKAPVEVTVVAPEALAPVDFSVTVNSESKGDSSNVTEVPFQSAAVLAEARFAPATRPDVVTRYKLADLFDGNLTTLLTLMPPDTDLDFIVELPMAEGAKVTGIEISAPEGIPATAYASALEVMVLPNGSMEGSGRDVTTFSLQSGLAVQSFSLPPSMGKALWIRLAGQAGAPATIIGDIRVLTSVAN